MWPKGFRKKRLYTAEELYARNCERDAEKILKVRGQGRILHIAPPFSGYKLTIGGVQPPGGGLISNWHYHRAVEDGDRIYDLMTGPEGMPKEQYWRMFDERDSLVIGSLEAD
jgi:hypothetical protein